MKLRRTWPQRLVLALNTVLALSCFVAAGAVGYVQDKTSSIQRVRLSHVLGARSEAAGAATGEPMNVLLVGVDSADGLAAGDVRRVEREEEGIGGLRSDTMMVVRLMPAEGRVAVISFPRDLWVTLAGFHRDKINAAMYYGGPELLIATIEENFGIPLHHYAQVDFAQFEQLVEAIDGVRMYFDAPVRDEWTGLEVTEPGCVTLRGDEALAYARSRHYERFDPRQQEWVSEQASDLGRISRQQEFIRHAVGRAASKGARNPFTLNRLVDVGLKSVQLDDGWATGELVALAMQFRSFDSSRLETYELPVEYGWEGEVSVLRLVEADAEPVLALFRDHGSVGPDQGGGSSSVPTGSEAGFPTSDQTIPSGTPRGGAGGDVGSPGVSRGVAPSTAPPAGGPEAGCR